MIDITTFKTRLKEFNALRDDDKIQTRTLEHIQPQFADEFPAELDVSLHNVLINAGIDKLYQHQADAISKSLRGADVVLESPTASGKTLAFTLPMLQVLVNHRDSHALMIYPMKALAFDQRAQIDQLCEPLGIESWTFDRDTAEEHKKCLKNNPPEILLTNPEYLNMSFLGWRDQWEKFLRNLRYIVIDEMHEYRGFFGSNMALLLRRFFLHLNRIGASPSVFLSTATCANPEEHAKNITGRDVEVVCARNVLRPKRHFLFVNPEIRDYKYRDILRLRVECAALTALSLGLQVLVFCPTKRFLEASYRQCKRNAVERKLDPNKISLFHADITSEERRDIQQEIKDGSINIVFTTNALELGLDIGGLDGIILAGFPSSLMSAWQQIGRAGRGWNKEAFVLFYALNDPIDQFFVGNIDGFLNKPLDELVIDPNNEELIKNHLPALSVETNNVLHLPEKDILGTAFYDAAKENTGVVARGYKPHPYLKIRGIHGKSYQLKRGTEELGQISEMRRFREAYIGAVFTFFGQKYTVHAHEANAIELTDAEPNLKTDPTFFTVLNQANIFNGFAYGGIQVFYGTVDLSINFSGYKIIDEYTDEVRDFHEANDAYWLNNLHAFWVNMPESEYTADGLSALEHLIRVGAMFVIPADRFDTSTYSKTNDALITYYYENYPGGIGVAKKLFNVLPSVLEKGIEIAENCKCELGCQNCIEPAKSYNRSSLDINKISGIELATNLLEAVKNGPDRQYRNGLLESV